MRKLSKINTLVIKIGSSIISDENGVNIKQINSIAKEISKLKESIPNIIIVSSGAVASGFRLLGFQSKPKNIVDKQASAAVGQARLIQCYEDAFNKSSKQVVAQILITKDDLSNRKRFLNARSAILRLLELGVIPIVNENDPVIVDELKYIESFGDNDNLSALIASITSANLLLILSDVDGLYTADPTINKTATMIYDVTDIDGKIMMLAGASSSKVGTGGMRSKLEAAKKAIDIACDVAIIKGLDAKNISRFFNSEEIGTYFHHTTKQAEINKKKFWIGNAAIPKGKILVDDGAKKAIINKKSSLLPKGIVSVVGRFSTADVVSICDIDGIEIARGKTRYSSVEINKIRQKRTDEIYEILGYKLSDEVIHRNDLLIVD